MGVALCVAPVGGKVVVHALVDRRQLHVVAIEVAQVLVVARHGLVVLALKFHLHALALDAMGREALALQDVGLGHVAHGARGLMAGERVPDDGVDGPQRQREVAVEQVVPARSQEVGLHLAPAHAVDVLLVLPHHVAAQPAAVGHIVERKDVDIHAQLVARHLVFDNERAAVDNLGIGVEVVLRASWSKQGIARGRDRGMRPAGGCSSRGA